MARAIDGSPVPNIADFIDRLAPASPATCGADIYERFEAEPNTLALAVVDDDGRPLGLIERNAFFLHMASHYGRALYARRPVTAIMDVEPLIIEGDRDLSHLFHDIDESQFGTLLKGFVVVRDGRYVGVGTAVHVLKAGYALNRKRADEMAKLAEDLAWAEAEAKASSRAKSQFLAVMSHEIRTPLNGVLGIAELMDRKLAQPRARAAEIKPYVRTILESGQGLLRLLTDALDLSRAEAGALTLDERPFDLRGLVADLETLWLPLAEQKGLSYSVNFESDEDLWALGDNVRLKQVFNNLIGNALKFTERGGVTVQINGHREGQFVRIHGAVTDTGPGVPADAVDKVFEPFATGPQGAGAGLGLSICRELVERMDGKIRLESPPQGGARFAFDIVLFHTPAQAAEAAESREPPTHHDTAHVLVVDDNATNRFVACKLLETFGCTHETAENGQEAVEAVSSRRFDLVLMDIKMPVLDGVEATRAIRALAGAQSRVPIVALTANADRADEATYLEAGMDEVTQKPIRPDLLLDAVRRALTKGEELARAAA